MNFSEKSEFSLGLNRNVFGSILKTFFGAVYFISTLLAFAAKANPRPEVMANQMVEVIEKMKWSNRCEGFVSKEQIGPLGQHIIRSLNRTRYPELYRSTEDFKKVCPNFNNLRDAEKDYVWVMFLTAIAFFESTCNPRATAVAPNGVAQGLMQLHFNREASYSDGCTQGDSLRPNLSLSCSLSMLNDQIRRGQKIFDQSSYWEVLRPKSLSDKAKNVAWAMMFFAPCKKR